MHVHFKVIILLLLIAPIAQAQKTGLLIDPRDGKQYPTIQIGDQWWTAQNMAFALPDSLPPQPNTSHGLLYTWDAALHVCPSGWHLPSKAEWDVLLEHLGVSEEQAGKLLKSTTHWEDNGNGTNTVGFNAKPGGYWSEFDEVFTSAGLYGNWWTSSSPEDGLAWSYTLDFSSDAITSDELYTLLGYSVRCLRDE